MDIDMSQWDDWMKWEGAEEMVHSYFDRRPGLDSSDGSIWQCYDACDEILNSNASFDLDREGPCNSFLSPDAESGSPDMILECPSTKDIRTPTPTSFQLSFTEERYLRSIAMPKYPLSDVTIEEDEERVRGALPAPKPKAENRQFNKKRKSFPDSNNEIENETEIDRDQSRSQKRGHNAIEKRYRTNLNDKIYALQQRIPSLRKGGLTQTSNGDVDQYCDGNKHNHRLEAAARGHKYSKAVILTQAVEYITHLEESIRRLNARVTALEMSPEVRNSHELASMKKFQTKQSGMLRVQT